MANASCHSRDADAATGPGAELSGPVSGYTGRESK